MVFGTNCNSAFEVTKAVRDVYKKCMIVKLSPNVTDITEIAKSVESAGADAVSLINTILAMSINAETRKPFYQQLPEVCQDQQLNLLPCVWSGRHIKR